MELRILFLGDLVGAPGKRIVRARLRELREALRADAVIANVENLAGGSGITRTLGADMLKAGVDLMTLGDHAYGKRDQLAYIDAEKALVRPANYPPQAPGRDLVLLELERGPTLALFQVQGRVFLPAVDCPFVAAERILERARVRTPVIVCDMHAEATSEKVAMGWHLDGRVSAVLGTHTHIQTADERVLPGGTAYITDVGMSGPYDSVIGRKREAVLQKFITNVPAFFSVADGDVRLSGALVTVDAERGAATSIRRVHLGEDEPLGAAVR